MRLAGCQGRCSTLLRPCRVRVSLASIPCLNAIQALDLSPSRPAGLLCARRGHANHERAAARLLRGLPYGRRPNAFFQRFFGSSNFTAAGSNASGSKLPPAHRSVDSCSS